MPAVDVSPVAAGQAYLELHHQIHRVVDRAMCCAGLSLARAKVLTRVSTEGPMNQARLAGLLGFAPRSVTETVDALERDGLVTRAEDPHDRRARIVSLTEAGHEAHAVAQRAREKAMTEVFGGLSDQERHRLVAICTSIRDAIQPGENCS